jgi:diguanylate cyclase (GGDEF)-like protein
MPTWLMQVIAWGGAGTHLVFLVLFMVNGWNALALMNVVSVLLYLGISQALRIPRYRLTASFVASGEIFVHAVVATLALGWHSGFHVYLLCLCPVVFVGTRVRIPIKWLCMGMLGASYAALRYVARDTAPYYDVSEAAQYAMEYINIAGMVVVLSQGSHMYYTAVLTGHRRLMRLAHTDPLTGLPNRRQWLDAANAAHARLLDEAQPYAVILCDLDHFKAINDRHGHAGGDDALRALGQALCETLRRDDLVGRWGGEEFAVLLPDTDLAGAVQAAQDLRRRVDNLELTLDGHRAHLSMTLGVAEAQADESLHELLRRADAAMYRGKHAGRNRVVKAEAPVLQPPLPA